MSKTAPTRTSKRSRLALALLAMLLALTSSAVGLGWTATARAGTQAPAATAWKPPTPSYRVSVTADGLYALDYAYLSAAGLPVDSIDPRTFRMFYMGQEIAIRVEGEGDGIFDPGDAVLFYARGVDSLYYDGLLPTNKYTGTNVFWLSYGGPNGLRMTARDGSGSGSTPASFPHREHIETSFWYWSSYPFEHDADHWYMDWVRAFGSGVAGSKSWYFEASHVYTGSGVGVLKADLLGYRDGPHHLRLYVNGNLVLDGSPTWSGFTKYTAQANVDQSYFTNGINEIKVEIVNDPPKTSDEIYVNWLDVVYRDTFAAENNALAFRNDDAGNWRYEISNFGEAGIEVYDVTDLGDVRYFAGTTVSGSGPYAVGIGDSASGPQRYLALTPSARRVPDHIKPATYPASSYSSPDLLSTANGADYIIITHRDFWADAQRLAKHRARDFRVTLVDVQQVYDQFNGGLMSAEAIRDSLAYAHTQWTPQPMYVVLLGDGSSDMRNYRYSAPTYIPPYLYLADPDLGETAADNRFVTIVGDDNMPDMHLGRLPANTAADAKAMVDKIIAYEVDCRCDAWNYNTLFVADDLEGGGGNFYAYSDEVAEGYIDPPANTTLFVPRPPYTVSKAYLGLTCDVVGNPNPATECQNQIVATLNNPGALFVSYVGHAGKAVWATETLLNQTLLTRLTNGPCLPIMLPMTCFEGSYHDPATTSLAEFGVRLPVHGTIASWSPTGFGLVTGHDYLEKGVVQALLHEGINRLGPATTFGKQYLLDNAPPGAYRDLLDTFVLIGDPGLQVKTDAVCSLIPTAVRVAGFRAQPSPGGVLLSWETENEADMLGFRVLRDEGDGSGFVVASPELIFAEHGGASRGASYTFLDRQVRGPGLFTYVLEVVKTDGSSERYGRAQVSLTTRQLFLPLVRAR